MTKKYCQKKIDGLWVTVTNKKHYLFFELIMTDRA